MFSCLENLNLTEVKNSLRNTMETAVAQIAIEIRDLFNLYDEMIDQIEEVRLLSEQIPERFQGKCYHSIRMRNGIVLQLIFSHVNFSDIEDHLKPGSMIKVIYRDRRVINIFPQPYYQKMPFADFLDRCDIDPQSLVRICYFNGQVRKIDFLGIIPEMSEDYLSDEESNDELATEADLEESEVKLEEEEPVDQNPYRAIIEQKLPRKRTRQKSKRRESRRFKRRRRSIKRESQIFMHHEF